MLHKFFGASGDLSLDPARAEPGRKTSRTSASSTSRRGARVADHLCDLRNRFG